MGACGETGLCWNGTSSPGYPMAQSSGSGCQESISWKSWVQIITVNCRLDCTGLNCEKLSPPGSCSELDSGESAGSPEGGDVTGTRTPYPLRRLLRTLLLCSVYISDLNCSVGRIPRIPRIPTPCPRDAGTGERWEVGATYKLHRER